MTKRELDLLEEELTTKGYRRCTTELLGYNCSYYWYKPFGESPYEEDRSVYQLFFLIYDFRPYRDRDPQIKPFGCQALLLYSRSVEERVDVSLGHGVKSIDHIERFAQSFSDWYSPRYTDDDFYAYPKIDED